ncbi:MAG: helix-turn-helix domain-containing protein [Candidatus Omnitrophica bacterium]|nr:helix-turn-helix domain-containing protein [Candidatus Omnitrophota bacterium]
MMNKKYYNSKEFAEISAIPRTTLYGWADDGTIPAVKIPHGKKHKYIFPKEETDKWLERFKIKTI